MSQRYIGGLIYNPPGGFSGYFDGSDDLNAPSNAAFTYGTSDFTIEGWFFITGRSGPNDYEYLFAQGATTGSSSLGVYRQGGVLKVWNGSAVITGTTTLTLNAWNHIALSRSGTTMRLFLNGAQEGSATNSNSISTGSSYGISVGRWTEVDTNYIVGYVSNFRVVKGTAVYTSAFTPPVGPLQAITNTQLLTCAYPTFRDGSTNNFTITVNGNTAVSTQNPFPLTTLPNPALGNQGNGVYSMSQYQSLLSQNLWPAVDPYWRYVTLMLHGNGTNGAQNNTFLDSSTNNFTITRNGNTTQGTFSPYGNLWSNYFDGSGDWLSVPDNNALDLSGDFTIEFWLNVDSGNLDRSGVVGKRSQSTWNTDLDWVIRVETSAGKIGFGYDAAGNYYDMGSYVVGEWAYYAITRSGTSIRTFKNGVQIATATDSRTYTTTESLRIGINGPGLEYKGYISNMRIVKGTAVYTSAFTPSTTPLTAITNTSLLTCQSNRFVDNSTNNFTVSIGGGTPSVQRFSPFNPTAPYAAGIDGGSGYFDGTGDYLTAPDNAALNFGTGNFCIECFFYPTTISGTQGIAAKYAGGDGNRGFNFEMSSGVISCYVYSGGGSTFDTIAGGTAIANAWNHIVLCRSGTTLSAFLNGVRTGTSSNSYNITSVVPVAIGANVSTTGASPFFGYIASTRIVKGSTPYDPTSSTLTVPTAPVTAITNTSLLCNFTNAGIIDNAEMNNLETVGNAQISTAQSKFGGASMLFDGTGDWIASPANPNVQFGTGDFTVEAWVYRNGSQAQFVGLVGLSGAASAGWFLSFGASNVLTFGTASGTVITSSSALTNTAWVHVAVSRSGTSLKMFFDGVQVASATDSTSFTDNAYGVRIGGSSGYSFNGYIDDLRITKGYARYTTSFTPQRSQWQDQ